MTHYDKRGGGVAKYGVISPLGVMNNGRMPLMDGRHPFSPIRPSPSFSFAMKRAAWDGVRLYAGPINAYQQFANAFVAAAQPVNPGPPRAPVFGAVMLIAGVRNHPTGVEGPPPPQGEASFLAGALWPKNYLRHEICYDSHEQ